MTIAQEQDLIEECLKTRREAYLKTVDIELPEFFNFTAPSTNEVTMFMVSSKLEVGSFTLSQAEELLEILKGDFGYGESSLYFYCRPVTSANGYDPSGSYIVRLDEFKKNCSSAASQQINLINHA